VIACCTAHGCLPELPAALRAKIISLIELTDDELGRWDEPALLLASAGTYQKRLFHEGCRHVGRIRFLSEGDQQQCMRVAYDILKKGGDPREVLPWLEKLLEKYATRSIICGCTEFHLVARVLAATGRTSIRVIDPLSLVARELNQLLPTRSVPLQECVRRWDVPLQDARSLGPPPFWRIHSGRQERAVPHHENKPGGSND
jgi:aspartate racemase